VLLAARIDVTWLQHNPAGPDDYGMRLDRIRTALDQGIDLKRRVVEELRPTLLDTMGLVAALRWQIEETCRRADLTCRQQFPEDEPVFSRAGAITLFRVVQEALANVIKHSRARQVDIALECIDQHVLLTIGDDGVGSTRRHSCVRRRTASRACVIVFTCSAVAWTSRPNRRVGRGSASRCRLGASCSRWGEMRGSRERSPRSLGRFPTRRPRCQEAWYEARLEASSLRMLGSRS
jgi:hypothetical protein